LSGAAATVGFGIRGSLTGALGIPFVLRPFFVEFVDVWQAPLLLLQHLLTQLMVGLTGGASLGAALGYLACREPVGGRSPGAR
jgi:hypothetical protein